MPVELSWEYRFLQRYDPSFSLQCLRPPKCAGGTSVASAPSTTASFGTQSKLELLV